MNNQNSNFDDYNNYRKYYSESNSYTYDGIGDQIIHERNEVMEREVVNKSYLLMVLVTLVSGICACISYSGGYFETLVQNNMWYACIAVELATVFLCTRAAAKNNAVLSGIMLLVYSIVNGVTLASIFYLYELSSILVMFFIASAMFAGLALYGTITKRDFSVIGRIGFMALIGVILLTLCNLLFLHSTMFDLGLCVVGLALFIGITVYDAQMVKRLSATATRESVNSIAIICALNLYLDFINIFLYLLELFGDD